MWKKSVILGDLTFERTDWFRIMVVLDSSEAELEARKDVLIMSTIPTKKLGGILFLRVSHSNFKLGGVSGPR